MNLSVNFAGVTLNNPITTASGTFGNGREMGMYYNLSELGGVGVKAITKEPRLGNPPIRVAETAAGMLNSVGLQNPGIRNFMEVELPNLKRYDTKIIANISGHSVEENCELAQMLGSDVDLIELNVSCPNVKHGGMAFGVDVEAVYEITSRVKERCKVPLMVKLSPNVTDVAAIARSAERGGADALSLINTLLGMKIDVNTKRPLLHNNVGGLSGPAVKPIAVRMVWQVANAVKLPILGMGGIMTGEDAAEFMLAGATAVAVGTANLVNPTAALDIKQELVEYMNKHGISDVNQLIGGVIPW